MANKEYLTLKRCNDILALYGLRLNKRVMLYRYALDRIQVDTWVYRVSRIAGNKSFVLPAQLTTNKTRVEHVINNLERLYGYLDR